MSTFELVTGEAVALDLRPAALPSRVVAGAIDALLQLTLLVLLGLLTAATGTSTSVAGQAAISVLVVLGVLAGYPIAFESLLRGRTPGKAAMGLRVVRDDGGPIGFRQALVRGLTSAFVERPGVTVFTGAVICMLLNDRSKRLGDLLAGTVVLQERVAAPIRPGSGVPPPLAGWAAELDLAGLPDELALSVRSYLARARELTPAARDDLGARLTAAVAAVVTPPPPEGAPAWAYLAAVLAERSRRAEGARAARPQSAARGPQSATGHPQTPASPLPAATPAGRGKRSVPAPPPPAAGAADPATTAAPTGPAPTGFAPPG